MTIKIRTLRLNLPLFLSLACLAAQAQAPQASDPMPPGNSPPDISGGPAGNSRARKVRETDNGAAELEQRHSASVYFGRAEMTAHPAEKAQYYLLSGQIVSRYPDAVPGQTARGLYLKAADVFKDNPKAPGADKYFLQAKLADPENADWPYLVAVYNWDKHLNVAEQYLHEALECSQGSPETFSRARSMLKQIPQRQAVTADPDTKVSRMMARAAAKHNGLPSKFSSDNLDNLFQDGPGQGLKGPPPRSHWWNKLQEGY